MSITHFSQSELQHRKMMVFLPVVVVPFVTIFFYLFGGGKDVSALPQKGSLAGSGLNSQVPQAWKGNEIYNSKLKAYEQVEKDSMRAKERSSRSLLDNGHDNLQFDSLSLFSSNEAERSSALNYDINQSKVESANSPEKKAIDEATNAYEQAMIASGEKPPSMAFTIPSGNSYEKSNSMTARNSDSARNIGSSSNVASFSKASSKTTSYTPLPTASRRKAGGNLITKEEALKEKLIDDYNSTQLRSQKMLELLQKRLENENAALAAAHRGEDAPKEKLAVSALASAKITIRPKDIKKPVVTYLEQKFRQPRYIYQVKSLLSDTTRKGDTPRANNGFYSAQLSKKDTHSANVILAAIHNEQIVEAGSSVKIRLLHDIEVGGQRIPGGSFIFGVASIDGTRIGVSINSIYFKEMLFPVEIALYDLDGIKGLSTPASVSMTIAKQGAAQSLQGNNYIGTSPSPVSQLTQKAIEVGEKIASRKLTAVRVTLKAGHQVLLKPALVETLNK